MLLPPNDDLITLDWFFNPVFVFFIYKMVFIMYSRIIILSAVTLLNFTIGNQKLFAQDLIFPEISWQQAKPESEEVDSEKLETAVAWFERETQHMFRWQAG